MFFGFMVHVFRMNSVPFDSSIIGGDMEQAIPRLRALAWNYLLPESPRISQNQTVTEIPETAQASSGYVYTKPSLVRGIPETLKKIPHYTGVSRRLTLHPVQWD